MLKPADGDVGDWDGDFQPAGEIIGGYVVGACLGVGGFAEVYDASPPGGGGRVAIKLIRPGMDSRDVLARFRLEQRILEQLYHPGIVRILDAGITPGGRSWFAMEKVDGLPVTDYCALAGLSVPQRMALFAEICDAVQHAHHRAVLHRDLKPANILVKQRADGPQPKIIDFGIARALEPQGGGTMITRLGQVMGTPSYISPEQAAGSDEADTRSDIYSLGAVLYEMLTGQPPFCPADLRRISPADLHRHLLEHRLPPPSQRVRSAGGSAALARQLAGDVDHIVQLAMAPDPVRRYTSAAALAEDVRNWLAGRGVTARPPSLLHEMTRIMRRYRWQAAMVAAVALTALLAAAVLIRADREAGRRNMLERDRAVSAGQAAAAARTRAERQNYQASIRLASQLMKSGEPFRAAECLRTTEPALRGWEWRLLMASLPNAQAAVETGLADARLLACNAAGTHAAAAEGLEVRLADLTAGTVSCSLRFPTLVKSLSISADASLIAVACDSSDQSRTREVHVADRTGRLIWSMSAGDAAEVAWEREGDALLLVSGSTEENGLLQRLEGTSGAVLQQRRLPRSSVSGVGIILSNGGRMAAVRRSFSEFEVVMLPSLMSQGVANRSWDHSVEDILLDEHRDILWFCSPNWVHRVHGSFSGKPGNWERIGGEEPFLPHDTPIRRLNQTPDGSLLVIGDAFHRREEEKAEPRPGTADLVTVRISGGRRASLLPGGRIEIHPEIPPALPVGLRRQSGGKDPEARRLAFTPDSAAVVYQSWTEDFVGLMPVSSPEQPVKHWHRAPPGSPSFVISFAPDGTLIYGGEKGLLRGEITGLSLRSCPLPVPGAPRAVAFSTDGRLAAVGMQDSVILLDWPGERIVRSMRLEGGPFYPFFEGESGVFLALGTDGHLHRLGPEPESMHLTHPGDTWRLPNPAVHAGRRLLAAADGAGVSVFQLVGGGPPRRLVHLPVRGTPSALAFDASGDRLAVASVGSVGSSADRGIVFWDWAERLDLLNLPVRNSCSGMAFSPDGRWFAHTDFLPSIVLYGPADEIRR